MNNPWLVKLNQLSTSRLYWLFLAIMSFSLLASALYYQYVLEEWPCVLCIQVRLWLSLLLMISVIMALLKRSGLVLHLANLLVIVVASGLAERSYLLLGTERGFVFRNCGFDLGMPSWLALDKWLPWLYRVDASCGYTPELMFGVTMAEALMILSVALLINAVFIFLAALIKVDVHH